MLSILKGPYLQWPTQHAIIIMWETSGEASSSVTLFSARKVHSGLHGKYQTLDETGHVVFDPTETSIHAVQLTGLEPETTYHYRVSSTNHQGESVESEEYPLKTAVRQDTPFSFAVTSETGGFGDDATNRQVFSQIERYRPDFLLIAGDSVKNGTRYEDWDRWLFAPGKELFAHTPFYLCLGNHEENSPWYYRFVGYPGPKSYYAFDYGNTHVVALDSTEMVKYQEGRPVPTAALSPGSPQYEFLVSDLQATEAVWKVVFFHYPPYVSGDYEVEAMRALCPVLEANGVELVFTSHTIVYERSHPLRANALDTESGIVYIVAGGAGAKPDWWHHKRAWHTAQAVAVPHFVQVIIAGTTLELHAIDHQGRHFDTLQLSKTASTSTHPPNATTST